MEDKSEYQLPEGFGSDEELDRKVALLMQDEEAIRADEREKMLKAGYRKPGELLTPEEIKSLRPKPLDCGRCEVGGGECRLSELDKARCWARRVAQAQLDKCMRGE